MSEQTIFAPSTAIGGAIAIIRVSGSAVRQISKTVLSRNVADTPNKLCHVGFMDDDRAVDSCMAVFFAAPKTYTGEDMLEIHCHGGSTTVHQVLNVLSKTEARPAQNGEFTKRAFLNGKMDLSQAEAVMDIINADTEQSLRTAMGQHEGSVKRSIEAIEGELLSVLSGIDAAIDYPDEAEAEAYELITKKVRVSFESINQLIETGRHGRLLREGLRLAIIGKPNVGKSSLMNALLGSDRAIVTDLAGTTRDTIEEKLSIAGYPVRLIDTAGIHEAIDRAEGIGIERARQQLELADLILLVMDASQSLSKEDSNLLSDTLGKNRLVVLNKADIAAHNHAGDVCVSALTGQGMDILREAILQRLAPTTADTTQITNQRHLHALQQAKSCLAAVFETSELDCIATDITMALNNLGLITGTNVDEKTLDLIFENFCVGK